MNLQCVAMDRTLWMSEQMPSPVSFRRLSFIVQYLAKATAGEAAERISRSSSWLIVAAISSRSMGLTCSPLGEVGVFDSMLDVVMKWQ